MSNPAVPVRRSVLGAWVPVVAWAAVIFVLSSLPGSSTELSTWEVVLRKLARAAMGAPQQDALIDAVLGLERLADAGELARLLRVG